MTDAVRIFALDHPVIARTLKGKLQARHREPSGLLSGALDWPDFKKRLGALEGLSEAIAICDDTEKEQGE